MTLADAQHRFAGSGDAAVVVHPYRLPEGIGQPRAQCDLAQGAQRLGRVDEGILAGEKPAHRHADAQPLAGIVHARQHRGIGRLQLGEYAVQRGIG